MPSIEEINEDLTDEEPDDPKLKSYKLRNSLRLTIKEYAELMGVSVGTVQHWEYDQRSYGPRSPYSERILVLYDMVELLRGIERNIPKWFKSEIPALGGKRPFDVGKTYEGASRLKELAARIHSGIPL